MENQSNNESRHANQGADGAQKHSANQEIANESGKNTETYGFNPDDAREYGKESQYDNEGRGNTTGQNAMGSGSEVTNSTNTAGNSGNDPNEYGSH